MMGPAFFSYIGQGIVNTITRVNPILSVLSLQVFTAFAVIMLMVEGYKWMWPLTYGDRTDHLRILFTQITIGFVIVTCYERPIPFLGISFTNIITDTTTYLAQVMDARSMMQTYGMFQTIQERLMAPSAWNLLAVIIYGLILLALLLAKAAAMSVVAFGMLASAVGAVLGPIFVPFYIVPRLDFLFWNWLRAFIEYSMVPVVGYLVLTMFGDFLTAAVTATPAGLTPDLYMVYGYWIITFALTFAIVLWKVPAITASYMSGHGGTSGNALGAAASLWRSGRGKGK
jgi:hypothetical protein